MIHESPRALYTLTYTHPFTFYLGYPDSTQQSDTAIFTSIFRLTPVDELTLGFAAFRSDTRVAALRTPPTQAGGTPQATGQNLMLQANLTQGYTHEYTRQWRMTQHSDLGTVIPLRVPTPQTYRYMATLGGGPVYTMDRDSIGLDGEATYFYTTEVDEGGVYEPSSAQVVVGGTLRWIHDLSNTWSTELSGGLAGAFRTDPLRGGVWGPIGLGAIRYANEGNEASLSVSRTLGPNLVTANTVMADHVRLEAGLPISREYSLLFRAGAGYSHSRAIVVENAGFLATLPFATPESTENARLITTFNTFGADASVGWYPQDFLYFDLRYQFTKQVGVENQIAPAATFHRNLVMLNAGIMWPARDVAPVPARQPGRTDNADRDARLPGATEPGGRGRPAQNN